jgi:phosphoesterase RecJ-like protein
MTDEARNLIGRAQRIFLITHVDPDGDAIGSTLALSHALRKMGKECTLACADPVPEALAFLPGVQEFGAPKITDEDLIIAVDDSGPERFGKAYEHILSLGISIVNIDHHVTNNLFGTVNVVRTDAAATAEIVVDLLRDWGVQIDSLLATYLLTGIVTDTRCFSTSNTTPRTLDIAAQLMRAGASLSEINENSFKQKELATLHLWGRILDRTQLHDQLVWSVSTLDMQARCQAGSEDSDGIVNLLATAREAKAAIVFKERDGGQVDISIRSRPGVDISPIAVYFGGGGHPQAAGGLLTGSLEQIIPDVLTKAKEVLNSRQDDD